MTTENTEEELQAQAGQQDSQPVAEDGASSPMTSEEYSALNQKVADEGYEPTEDEWSRIDEYQSAQNNGEDPPEAAAAEKKTDEPKEAPTEDKAEKPSEEKAQTEEEKVLDAVANVRPNEWTDDQAKAIQAAMKRVGAKTPEEIPDKLKGLQQLVSEKGGEVHEIQSQFQATKSELEDLNMALADAAKGDPTAYQWLQEVKGINLAQHGLAPTAAQQQQKQDPEKPEINEDDIVDPVTHAKVVSLENALRERDAKLEKLLNAHQSNEAAQRKEQALGKVTDQMMAVADEFPEMYRISNADMRGMIRQHFLNGTTDPRLTPLIELTQFAQSSNMPDLRSAHIVKNEGSFAEALVKAQQSGAQKVLGQAQAPAIPNIREEGTGKQEKQEAYSKEDIDAMALGQRDLPDEWFNEDYSYNLEAIPAYAQQRMRLVETNQ